MGFGISKKVKNHCTIGNPSHESNVHKKGLKKKIAGDLKWTIGMWLHFTRYKMHPCLPVSGMPLRISCDFLFLCAYQYVKREYNSIHICISEKIECRLERLYTVSNYWFLSEYIYKISHWNNWKTIKTKWIPFIKMLTLSN